MYLPEEIENQQFEVSFRGYNTREVDEFLNKLRTDVEEILKEQETLKRKIAAAELIAKDAKDHEEDFIASMQADRSAADDVLASAKAEGERIIREAKNAAAGIMTEVRRRAGDISAESRKASQGIIDKARLSAEEIIKEARADAEEKLFSARTGADNIVKAASAHAKAIEDEARRNSESLTKNAAESAALCEEYMKELLSTADKLCHELDAELKNSAARITLLGKRITSMDIKPKPDIKTEDAVNEISLPEVKDQPEAKEEEAPAHASVKSAPENTDASEKATAEVSGYFTEEYKQVMTELFGEDSGESAVNFAEDDDTYDYFDKRDTSPSTPQGPEPDEDTDDYDGPDIVTSEYTGLPSSGNHKDNMLDIFTTDTLDRVYKSPSEDDINDIMNG